MEKDGGDAGESASESAGESAPSAPTAPTPKRKSRALFAPAAVVVEKRGDGTLILRSPVALGVYTQRVGDWLTHWADVEPDRPFLAERRATGEWQTLSYSEVASQSGKLAAGLVRRKLSAERPLVVLSENGVEHALLMLAAMQVGIPIAPLSPAYSLQSKDFAKLKAIVQLLKPGMVYAADESRYGNALTAIRDLHDGEVVVGAAQGQGPRSTTDATPIAALYVLGRTAEVALAAATVGPDMIAKFLFTSGSTGEPKAVINTHRMLTSNQQAKLQTWPFLANDPPVIVDWLPWSHTFGGNHNFNMVLANGGTLYIDSGRPLPGLFERTIANLRDVASTIHFNVPRGYDMLIRALDADDALRERFFSRMKVLFTAGAALPQNMWDALNALSSKGRDKPIPLVTSWGSTETAPLATDCHFQAPRSGVIGVPVPGTELKLIPQPEKGEQRDSASSDKFEIRVRGPNVTPGYWKQPELTARAFDDEGFYRIGDAVRFADQAKPERGLVFEGRIAEDFKLATGTRVQVGSLRIRAIAALAPIAQDVVVTGHDCDCCGFLVFPNVVACRAIAGLADDASNDHVLADGNVRDKVREGLAALKSEGGGSSTWAARALLLSEPPSIDAGEITDKGYINQRAVRERRSDLVDVLDGRAADSDPPRVIAL